MVKLNYSTCRHCGHLFIPRVEYPRQCGKCWKAEPLKRVVSTTNLKPQIASLERATARHRDDCKCEDCETLSDLYGELAGQGSRQKSRPSTPAKPRKSKS